MKVTYHQNLTFDEYLDKVKELLTELFSNPEKVEIDVYGSPPDNFSIKYGKFYRYYSVYFDGYSYNDNGSTNKPLDPNNPKYLAKDAMDTLHSIRVSYEQHLKHNAVDDDVKDFLK